MPDIAAEWGCDDATWASIKSKRSLIKICDAGDEDHFKKRLESIKELIANPPPVQEKKTPPAKTGRKRTNKTKVRKEGPYELYGGLPDALDEAAITVKVNERAAAKEAKDYSTADAIREALAEKGVRIRDDMRTWSYKNPAAKNPSPSPLADCLSEAPTAKEMDECIAAADSGDENSYG